MFPYRRESKTNSNDQVSSFSFFGSGGGGSGGKGTVAVHGSSNGRNASTSNVSNNKKQPTIYKPRIDSYICHGSYYAHADRTNNRMRLLLNSDSKNSMMSNSSFVKQRRNESICNGYRTKVETLAFMDEMSRRDAIKKFSAKYSDEIDDNTTTSNNKNGTSTTDSSSSSSSNTDDLHRQWENVTPGIEFNNFLVPNVLIFSDSTTESKVNDMQDIENVRGRNSRHPVVIKTMDDTERVLEEVLIDYHSWKCVGSTQVDYLILKNIQTGEEKVTAVAPQTNGISKHRLLLEALNIDVIHSTVDWGDYSVVTEHVNSAVDDSIEDGHNNNNNGKKNKSGGQHINSISFTKDDAIKFATTMLNCSEKILEKAKVNTIWVCTNVQDDFPSRWYDAGTKIVSAVPKTVTMTANYMYKMFTEAMDDKDDNDDNDSNFPPRRR